MPLDSALYQEMSEVLHHTWTTWTTPFNEMKKDLEYYLGKQWTAMDRAYLEAHNRKALVINKLIRRFVHLLTGYQRQNRMDIGYKSFPEDPRFQVFTEQLSHLCNHDMDANEGMAHHHISHVFSAGIKVGIDWLNLFPNYDEDWVNGDIHFTRVPWTKIMPDPLFQNVDLSDCTYLFRREKLTKRQVGLFMPDVKIKDLPPSSHDNISLMEKQERDMLSVDEYILTEYWQRERKKARFVVDVMTGEKRRVDPQSNVQIDAFRMLMQQNPNWREISKPVETVTLQMFLGPDLVYKGEDPTGCEDYPYVPYIAYFDPEYETMSDKLQGIIRALRDPQDELNKRRSQILHAINSTVLSGWKYEEGALADESQIADASGAGVKLKMKAGKMEGAEQLQGRSLPPELIKLEEMFAADGPDITGINAELLSMMDDDKPGISIQLRQRQGLIIIQELFDNFKLFKQVTGRRYENCVKNNYNADKVARILHDMPAPEFYTKNYPKMQVQVDENPETQTQKEYNFMKMQKLREMMPIHPMILLDLADIPEKYKPIQAQYLMGMMAMQAAQPEEGGGQGPPNQGGQQ